MVRCLASGEAAGLLWLAMEYVPGTDAGKKVQADGPMAATQAVRATVFDLPRDAQAAYRMIAEDEPVPLPRRRPDVPPLLATMIHAALAKNPADRPASADEFPAALLPFAT